MNEQIIVNKLISLFQTEPGRVKSWLMQKRPQFGDRSAIELFDTEEARRVADYIELIYNYDNRHDFWDKNG